MRATKGLSAKESYVHEVHDLHTMQNMRMVKTMADAQDPTPAQARRARRLASKREAVRQAAVRLALDQGLEHATVEAISEAADITPRTFYNYFASKEDALAMERSWTGEEVASLLRSRPGEESVWESLREVLTEVAVSLEGKHDSAAMYHELHRRHPELLNARRSDNVAELSDPLTEAVSERIGADPETSTRPVMLVQAALAIMQAAIRLHWSTAEDVPIQDLVAEGFAVLTPQ